MRLHELFWAKALPVFQNKMFPDEKSARGCPVGDVILVQDMTTGLIFNAAFDASLLEYDADYQNEQACSGIFQRHLDDVKEIIHRHFNGKQLIEVGCGKGFFLEYLRKSGYRIIGIDPAYEGENPNVIKSCFDIDLGLSAEGIVLRHVLEHMSNPLDFLSAIAKANGGKGQIYIEVPCFDWICRNRAWFDIFYEHVNYFRLADFHRMFGTVHESGHIFGGQYLYVVADIATLHKPVFKADDRFSFPVDFLDTIARSAATAKGKRNAIWGGASKGVIFALYMERAGVNIDMIIDINPAKQGKFIAGSGLRVSTPDEAQTFLQAGDDIFVMNSNYLQEIVEQSNNRFNYLKVDYNEL
jgi:SAM-dependent methyltransferase